MPCILVDASDGDAMLARLSSTKQMGSDFSRLTTMSETGGCSEEHDNDSDVDDAPGDDIGNPTKSVLALKDALAMWRTPCLAALPPLITDDYSWGSGSSVGAPNLHGEDEVEKLESDEEDIFVVLSPRKRLARRRHEVPECSPCSPYTVLTDMAEEEELARLMAQRTLCIDDLRPFLVHIIDDEGSDSESTCCSDLSEASQLTGLVEGRSFDEPEETAGEWHSGGDW